MGSSAAWSRCRLRRRLRLLRARLDRRRRRQARSVTALWFAPEQALLYFIYAALLGGLLTLPILQLRTRLMPAFVYRIPWIAHLQEPKAGVPYGAAMAPAALIVFPDTAWLAHAAF